MRGRVGAAILRHTRRWKTSKAEQLSDQDVPEPGYGPGTSISPAGQDGTPPRPATGAAPAPGGPGTAPRRRRGRRWQRRVVAGILAALLIVLIGGAATFGYVRYRFAQVKKVRVPGLAHPAAGGAGGKKSSPITILLVGSNTRTGLDPSEARFFGTSQDVGGARSDVTMLLRLSPATGAATLLSIPRDLFVPLPPHSVAGPVGKIDAALNDGPEHLVEAVTNDLGIPIDHYVEINFDGFQHVINALGGIDMFFPTPLRDKVSGLNITQAGCQHLGGFQALAVVRSRHLEYLANGSFRADPLSDFSRIRRDHEFLKVFVRTMKAKGLNDPLRANVVLGNLVHQVTIDSGFGLNQLIDLLRRYRNLNPDLVPTVTLPVTLVNNYRWQGVDYGDVVMPSEPQDHEVIANFLGGPPEMAAPASVKVDVVDASGIRGRGTAVAGQLSALGFLVGTTTVRPARAQPGETLIRYHSGSVTQARALLSVLHGSVILEADDSVVTGQVVVEAGSVLAVASPAPAPPASSATTSPPATASSVTRAAAAPVTTTSTTTPTPGGVPVSPAQNPLQPFDPTACPSPPTH